MITQALQSMTLSLQYLALSGWWLHSVAATELTFPVITEINLVFPRNDTYAPVDLMPIVFAVQHPVPADYQGVQEYLGLDVKWSLAKLGDSDGLTDYGFRNVKWINYTESEAHFVVDYTNRLNDTEGLFAVTWSITTKNCSADPLVTDNFGFYVSTNVTFTVKKGAAQPDFVAAAGPDTCDAMWGQAINVTGATPFTPMRDTCAILAKATPAPNPCALKVDEARASSLSAEITASACGGLHSVKTEGCPLPESVATRSLVAGAVGEGWLMAAAALLGLVHAIQL